MDHQLFELIAEMRKEIREDFQEINKTLKAHVEKDELYWKKIDIQEGQVGMLKKMIIGASMIVGGIWTAIWSWVKGG